MPSPSPTPQKPSVPGPGQATLLLEPGTKPLAEYQLVRKLGEGGFGQVWRAKGPGGFEVALKFVKLSEAASLTELKAMKMIKGIRHANLLTIFGVWAKSGWLIVAMELADRTLRDRLKEAKAEGYLGIPRTELLEYMRDAAKGLDFLNEKNILHRDVKPHNLFLSGNSVKVADYGLAKLLESAMTSVSTNMTPAYAAPEILEGKGTKWSDQYSLGVCYCQLRTNQLPFTGGSIMETIAAHLVKPPELSALPQAERPVVERALAKDPRQRWPTCKAFVEALALVLANTHWTPPVEPEPPTAPNGQTPWPQADQSHNPSRTQPIGPQTETPSDHSLTPQLSLPTELTRDKSTVSPKQRFSSDTIKALTLIFVGLSLLTAMLVMISVLASSRDSSDKSFSSRRQEQHAGPEAPVPGGNARQLGQLPTKLGGKFVNSLGMTFTYIPAGGFLMGSPDDEKERNRDEQQHRVRITKPFCLGIHEVTQLQYQAVMGQNPSHFQGAKGGGIDHPVEQVSWEDAQDFIRRLNEREKGLGHSYRLPTEAEWEYACRAGTTSRFHAGEQESQLGEVAWFAGNADHTTNPVGSKKPNGWGLYDMHGNIMEWCEDWYAIDIVTGSPTNDPMNRKASDRRVLRGGNWNFKAGYCRSACRARKPPDFRDMVVGFRVVVVPAEVPSLPTQLGQTFTNSVGMTFTYIPAGEFLMGSPDDEKERRGDEYQHRVRITKPFCLGIHEVTQEQYQRVMGQNPSHFQGACGGGPNHPVEQASWEDAQEFLRRLNEREKGLGRAYRLPTEAEWEYACRAGTKTPFHSNGDASHPQAVAWFSANAGEVTHPVGTKQPNAWGLYDMHGNVWELCQDGYAREYYKSSPLDDPLNDQVNPTRVIRGGSWAYREGYCRAAARAGGPQDFRSFETGFRVVVVPLVKAPLVQSRDPVTNSVGMTFTCIPAGEFLMGSPVNEMHRKTDEEQHRVRITKPFYLGIHEVTQEQYQKVMGHNPSLLQGEKGGGPNYPVEQVSWQDAQAFLSRLNELEKGTGRVYRLPTEAEWEYACRAGSRTRFHSGDDDGHLEESAWFDANAGSKPQPVGQKKPNAWGLYDMHGNVWEWCQDWYAADFYLRGSADDAVNEQAGTERVLRGGSTINYAKNCRAADRGRSVPGNRVANAGFRVVLVLSKSP
jgi:formylglycine-generating enzyme required for sulfatase activity